MAGLGEQIQSVTGGVAPIESTVVEAGGGAATNPAPEGGQSSGNEGAAPADRPAQNYAAEFNRKLEKARNDFQSQLAQTEQRLLAALRGGNPAPAATASAAAPAQKGTLAEYSDADLAALQQNPALNPQQRAIIDGELNLRRSRNAIREELGAYDRNQKLGAARANAVTQALNMYPTLTNPDSPFAQAVDAELANRQALYGETPTEVLDAANAVARRMGVRPEDGAQRGFVAGSGSAPAPSNNLKPLDDATVNHISSRLAGALPPGKTFDAARIQERTAGYVKKYGGN